MTLLILGIVLWYAGHFFKRLLPGVRERLGDRGKGLASLLILGGMIAMIFGYRSIEPAFMYHPPMWGRHANNLMMLIAVILFGMGNSRGKMRAWMRHPMLTGVLVWSAAHLLANGDERTTVLFGSMALWAVLEILVINAKEGPWKRPEPGPIKGDVILLVASLVGFGLIAAVHTWIGYYPFPGG